MNIDDLPWYMIPTNMLMVIAFLYISGFLVCNVCFHSLLTHRKIEKGQPTTFTTSETMAWLLLSVFWFLMGLVCLYHLMKSFKNS